MFLINSRQGSFIEALNSCELGQSISKTYGRCIAEFLNEVSPVHLSTLILVYLCRFAVRNPLDSILKNFLGRVLL